MTDIVRKEFSAVAESGDQMIVGGLITTPHTDRHGDQIEMAGVDYSHLKVLLESHSHTDPVGTLLDIEERAEGLYARFKVASESAWQKVKAGLFPSFSIGFLPLKAEPIDTGWLYKSIELLECSLVSCPSNRQSSVLEIRSTENLAHSGNNPAQEATMTEATVKKVGPAVHTKSHEYSLTKAMKGVLENRTPVGLEGEQDAELRHQQPWREFGGIAVPAEQIFLSKQQRAELTKASGVVNPTNLEPTTGEEYRDELFAWIDAAIGKQLLSGQVGARTITGLTEASVRIPRQTAMMSAGHVALDSDLPDSSDPTFSNQLMTPKLVGSVAQLQLSAILAQHPRISEDYFGSELRRALIQEVERVFLNGDNTGTPAEPDGLVNLADNTNSLTIATASAIEDMNAAMAVYRDYTQTVDGAVRWVIPPELTDAMEVAAAFTGSSYPASETLRNKGWTVVPALNLPETTGTYSGFMGDFSYVVHGMWQGIDLSLNPYADSVFAKKATLLRVSMLHDYQIIDPKRVLQLAITP